MQLTRASAELWVMSGVAQMNGGADGHLWHGEASFLCAVRGCRIEPTGNGFNVSRGVKASTRDNVTGRMLLMT